MMHVQRFCFANLNLVLFLTSSLPSTSSLLKLPNAHNLSLPLQPLHRPTLPPPPAPCPPQKPLLERNLGPRKKIQDGAWKLPTFSERDELYSDFNVCNWTSSTWLKRLSIWDLSVVFWLIHMYRNVRLQWREASSQVIKLTACLLAQTL